MKTYPKPDGIIEIAISGCCCPPGQKHNGMHTCACTFWWRVGSDPWQHIDSISDARILAGAAETVAQFKEAMK